MSDQQDSGAQAGGSGSSSSSVNVQQVKNAISNKFQANKQLVLKLHSVLTWEQDIYPLAVFGAVSISFLIVHCLNSSVLTTLSYVGIAFALFDLALPTIGKNLAGGQAKLAEKDQQRFDKICLGLAEAYAFLRAACDSSCALKTSKPKLYYPALLGSLLVSAYIGNKFNNLFLTYVVALFVALYPGLQRRGYLDKVIQFAYAKVGRTPPSSAGRTGAGERRASGKK